jgi:hypothetical protein
VSMPPLVSMVTPVRGDAPVSVAVVSVVTLVMTVTAAVGP